MNSAILRTELPLLGLLALLWGASYLFIKVAVAEIPPVTLIAFRVLGAAVFLLLIMRGRAETLPRDLRTWRMLLLQAVFNSDNTPVTNRDIDTAAPVRQVCVTD